MVECFSIEEERASFFRELAGIEFDFARDSYFLARILRIRALDCQLTARGTFPIGRHLKIMEQAALMFRQAIIPTLLFLALLSVVVGIVMPAPFSQSSPTGRTFKEPEDDLDKFVGKVKTIHVDIEEHEFQTHFMDLGSRYKRKPFRTSQFNRDGKRLEKFNYSTDGVPLPKTTYAYDTNGLLLKEHHFSAVSGKPYLETAYTYEPQGRIKEEIGKNLEKDTVLSRKIYTHDDKRNYTEVIKYDWNNAPRERIGIIWDREGRVSELVGLSPVCSGCRWKMAYDDKGRHVEMILTRPGAPNVEKEKYTYEDDRQGNWIKKTLYRWVTEEGKSFYKLMNITYRTLTYY